MSGTGFCDCGIGNDSGEGVLVGAAFVEEGEPKTAFTRFVKIPMFVKCRNRGGN